MRVAWQAGAIAALAETGKAAWKHGDGTSGGIFNLAALASGISPTELVERWCDLDVRKFVSFRSLDDYLQSPTDFEAFGDGDGIVKGIFPALGIDVDTIRSNTEFASTFNVANFTTKTAFAIPGTDIDVERLLAGVSLPLFMPAVKVGADYWTDAVWIKDANLNAAVDHGCDEIWLLWCIANTPQWGRGPLEQYVHMIELSANSALIDEVRAIAAMPSPRPRLHVIKPKYPLPLDPDYYFGRISSETLVAMGYRDAWRYLASMTHDSVVLDDDVTAMTVAPLGVRFDLHYRVELTAHADLAPTEIPAGLGDEFSAQITVEIPDIDDFRQQGNGSTVVGSVKGLRRHLLRHGRFQVDKSGEATRFTIRAAFGPPAGDTVWLDMTGELNDDPGFDLWEDVSHMEVAIHCEPDGTAPPIAVGKAKLGVGGFRKMLTSMEPTGAHDLHDRTEVVGEIGRFLFGKLVGRIF